MLQRTWPGSCIGSSLEESSSSSPVSLYWVPGTSSHAAKGGYQHRPHRSEDLEDIAHRFVPHANGSYRSTKSIDKIRAFMQKNIMIVPSDCTTYTDLLRTLRGTRISIAACRNVTRPIASSLDMPKRTLRRCFAAFGSSRPNCESRRQPH